MQFLAFVVFILLVKFKVWQPHLGSTILNTSFFSPLNASGFLNIESLASCYSLPREETPDYTLHLKETLITE